MEKLDSLMLPDVCARALTRVAVEPYKWVNDAGTTGTVTEIAFATIVKNCDVTAASFVGSTTVQPAEGSNSQTITITAYDGIGGSGTTVAVGTIANATPSTQYQELSLTLGSTYLAEGSVLTVKTDMLGTATIPSGNVTVTTVPR